MAHILMLAHSYYPQDPRIRREAEALVSEGIAVTVYCTRRHRPNEAAVLHGVRYICSPVRKTRPSLLFYFLEYLRHLAHSLLFVQRTLRTSTPPTLVHVHTLPDFLTLAALPARASGLPVILDFHEALPEFFASRLRITPDSPLFPHLESVESFAAGLADYYLTVNDTIADNFSRRLPVRPLPIYNSPDTLLFGPLRPPKTTFSSPFRFVYHGTLTGIYGLDLAIRAFHQLTSCPAPPWEFHLFGDGPARASLEQLSNSLGLSDRVFFHGTVPLDEIPRRIPHYDCGLVPTRKDFFLDMSLGTKILEYIHLGLPCIASDLNAITRVFGRDTLYYFRGNNIVDLARTIRSVLDTPTRILAGRVAACQGVYQSISWPVMRRRFLTFVLEILRHAQTT